MEAPKPITILIIEDNPGDQLLLKENLISTNLSIADIVVTETLAGASHFLHQQTFSLIFLDLFLPDSLGLSSFSALIKINARIPVIIYSGLSDTKIALNAITLGAQDFLIKGEFTVPLLEKAVRYSIERKHSADALEDSISRYNFLSKATHDMVWDWDLTTGVVLRNPEGWKKIFKSDNANELGVPEDWPLRLHADDREKVKQAIDDLINSESQQVFEVDFRVIRDDNTIGWVEDRGYIIRDEKGKALRIIGASHDITERKNAEEKVLLSEQRFKSLVQNGSDLLGILDAEGNYIYVSPSSKNILGYEPEFLIGKNPLSFIHEDDLQKVRESVAAVATKKTIKVPLFRLKNSLGKWRWIERTMTNMLDDPAVQGIVANSRDVTEKKLADDELIKLSMVAKETTNGVMLTDNDQKIVWVNNAFTKMFGYTLSEVRGKNPLKFLHGLHTDISVENYIKEQIAKKRSFVFELQHYTKAHDEIYVRVQVQPMFDENGDLKQYFSLQTDITRQKELEEKVEIEKANRQKEITDAVFEAHENERLDIGRELHDNINQILGAVRLYIGMARKNNEDRDSLLANASTFVLSAIEEIRKLSKNLVAPLKEISIAEAIEDLTKEIMLVHPIQITFIAKDFVEVGLTEKFKLNIFRIVQEQINNILKHAKATNIYIDIDACHSTLLTFSIRDDGIGFDTTKKADGLGLTNIKSRTELYNGTLNITSAPEQGSMLSVSFNKKDVMFGIQDLCDA
ncbi:MAG: PAS domain S-box protein [Bacteroidota bacterium]|nr:PAS domain S-box protein [Bacteroidota bacterium]